MSSRTLALLGVILVAVIAGAVGWYAGQQIRSPEQIAADTAAPEASLITVPVESRTLSRDVITRANAEFLNSEELTLNLAGAAASGAQPIVTGRVPEVGAEISEGTVALEVAGRPVFVLEGDLPSFRSIGPGSSGVDVQQLEEALLRLGFFVGDANETFDDLTEQALGDFYQSRGYSAPELSESEQLRLDNANDAIDRAVELVDGAVEALERSQDANERSDSQVLQEGQGLASAERALADAEYQAISVNIQNPQSAIDAAEGELAVARSALARALQEHVQAADNGIRGQQLEAFEMHVEQAAGVVAQADQQFNQLASARLSASRNAAAAVTRARESLRIAQVQVVESLRPPDYSSEQEAIADAEADLVEARADLVTLESEIGIVFPQSEFLFVSNLPRLISRVDIEAGQTVSDSVMRISGDDVTFTGGIAEISRQFVTVGTTVLIDDAGTGIEIEGVITELADNPGTNGEADSRYYFEVLPNGTFDSEAVVNVGNFRMTVPIERTEGDVISVPIAALSAGPDGSSRVEIELDDGSSELIEVVVGLEAEGFVEIDPVGRDLEPGVDRVVVGVDRTGGEDDSGADDDGG